MEVLGALQVSSSADQALACHLVTALGEALGLEANTAEALRLAVEEMGATLVAGGSDSDLMFTLRRGKRIELVVTGRAHQAVLEPLGDQEIEAKHARNESSRAQTLRWVVALPATSEELHVLAHRAQDAVTNALAGGLEHSVARQHAHLVATLRERLQVEGQLRADRERLQLALDVAEIGVCEVHLTGGAPLVNARALELLGVSSAQSVGELVARVRPEDRVVATALFLGEPVRPAFEILIAGARERWLRVDVRQVQTDTGELRLIALKDVTVQRRAQQRAEERVALEEQFLGIVSHDLKNPLATTSMGAESLMDSDLSPAQRQTAELIHRASGHALRLVHDLLDFARARIGSGIPIRAVPLDLGRLCTDVVRQAQLAHPQRELITEIEAGLRTHADPTRLQQVVQNLVENALTYSPQAEPVSVIVERAGSRVVLRVHNGGKAIPSERRDMLFQPLNRGGRRASASRRNLGLGLFIVREIVKAHGGTLEVDSGPDVGTTFSVHLLGLEN